MTSPEYTLDISNSVPVSTNGRAYSSRRRIHLYARRVLIKTTILVVLVVLLCLTTNNQLIITRSNQDLSELQNETLAHHLEREVRVLCWVMTTPKNHKTKATSVKNTWGKHCNRLIFVTSEESEDFETLLLPVEDKYELIWGKTREAFRFIYQHYRDEADWFMKADDDTFVFVENLRYMLYEYLPETPIYFGYKFSWNLSNKLQVYASGGAGYVLSKEALKRFVEIALMDDTKCRITENDGAEDLEMSHCLNNVGVIAGDSRDLSHKHRFWPLNPYDALFSIGSLYWMHKISYYHFRECRDCLSVHPVSFHYITPENMRLYEYLLYEFSLFGQEATVEKLPEKLGPENVTVPEADNAFKENISN